MVESDSHFLYAISLYTSSRTEAIIQFIFFNLLNFRLELAIWNRIFIKIVIKRTTLAVIYTDYICICKPRQLYLYRMTGHNGPDAVVKQVRDNMLQVSTAIYIYNIHIQYWCIDGKYRIYVARLRNGRKPSF